MWMMVVILSSTKETFLLFRLVHFELYNIGTVLFLIWRVWNIYRCQHNIIAPKTALPVGGDLKNYEVKRMFRKMIRRWFNGRTSTSYNNFLKALLLNDVEEMNEYMLGKWNKKVRRNDEVVILGDLSWGKTEETNELLGKLNGRLYLIQGNHDRFLKNKDYNASRFVWIKPYEELQDNKRKVILCHYPIICYLLVISWNCSISRWS